MVQRTRRQADRKRAGSQCRQLELFLHGGGAGEIRPAHAIAVRQRRAAGIVDAEVDIVGVQRHVVRGIPANRVQLETVGHAAQVGHRHQQLEAGRQIAAPLRAHRHLQPGVGNLGQHCRVKQRDHRRLLAFEVAAAQQMDDIDAIHPAVEQLVFALVENGILG